MTSIQSAMLIVESNCEHALCLRTNLWRSCLCDRIIHFGTGKDLLDFLSATRPDLPRWEVLQPMIIINAVTDDIDVEQIIRELKKNPELSIIPIVVISPDSNVDYVRHFYREGCSFCMVKPAEYSQLMDYIDAIGLVFSMPQTRLPMISRHHVHVEA